MAFVADLARAIWQVTVGALAAAGLLAVGMGLAYWFLPPSSDVGPKERLVQAARTIAEAAEAVELPAPEKRVIYLNREGATLTAGRDDSARNVSSVVRNAALDELEVPAFRSTPARWEAIVECVEEQFEAYDVDVVDQRPTEGSYVMVMVGGEPGPLAQAAGRERSGAGRLSGVAPLGREPVDDAVVFVFSRGLREQTRAVCETVAHEVGHAFGLDHALERRDPMSYLPRPGRRSFQDSEAACGERDARACANGKPGQNSHQHLLEVLGPRPAADGDASPAPPNG